MPNSPLERFAHPPVLRHLKRLTTKDGLIQHADHEVPDPAHGYSIDDNARALIVCIWYYRLFKDPAVLHLSEIYTNYLKRVEHKDGTFHNFVSFYEKVLDQEGSEDSIGRAIWALGETVASEPTPELVEEAQRLLNRTVVDKHLDHEHLRTKAYILLGLLGAGMVSQARPWAAKLAEQFRATNSPDWVWFEDGLYYANAILPYALARASKVLKDPELGEIAVQSYDWLNSVSRENGVPTPIGQNGWFKKGGEKALYDQQPLEAADMVLAAAELHELTGDQKYLTTALEWFSWYDGSNTQQLSLVNEQTGGIYDGLTPHGVNQNQGAESIVTYLLAYLALTKVANERP